MGAALYHVAVHPILARACPPTLSYPFLSYLVVSSLLWLSGFWFWLGIGFILFERLIWTGEFIAMILVGD